MMRPFYMRGLPRVLLLALVLAAFAWRNLGLTQQSLWRDEIDAVYFATRNLDETLSMFVRAGQNGALFFVALRPWFTALGTWEFVVRYPSVLAGALSIPLLWQVARKLTGRPWVALTAALLLAIHPYHLWYSQEGKMYSTITALVLLAMWFWLQGITRGGFRPWLGYLLTVSVALYTHLLIILIYPLHFAWFLIAWPQSKRHWRGYALTLAGLTLPYLPMVWWQWDMLTSPARLTGFNFIPLPEMARILLYNHSRGFTTLDHLLWIAPICYLAAAGLLLGAGVISERSHDARDTLPSAADRDDVENGAENSADIQALYASARHAANGAMRGTLELAGWRRIALLVSWLLLPPIGIYLMSLRQPIFTDRYVFWIAPAYVTLIALGIHAVAQILPAQGETPRMGWRRITFGTVAAAILLCYVLGFWLYAGWQQKTLPMKYDLRAGVGYVAERRTSDALLVLQIPHLEYAYRYYTSAFGPRPFDPQEPNRRAPLAPWAGGLWTNNGFADDAARAEVDTLMRRMTVGTSDVWVLRSEVEMWDQRHLMDEWLDAHGELIEQADFHGVQVRRYRLREGL